MRTHATEPTVGLMGDEREAAHRRRAEIARRHLRPTGERAASSARGVHHVALLSNDVERTVEFYQGLLEFPLTEMFENRDYGGSTHFFFDIGNGNALAFTRLAQAGIVAPAGGAGSNAASQSITDAYASALANIGVRVQGGKTAASISAAAASQAESTRANQAGVNLDEEAAKLIQYQQSYQAAAKILQVAQAIFDTMLQAASSS